MHLKLASFAYDVYRDNLLKDGEDLDELLDYIPRKDGKYKDGVFVKDGKIIRRSLTIGDPVWAAIDPILGRTDDESIAWFFGIPTPYIEARRRILKIRPYDYVDWKLIDPLFSRGTDAEISFLFHGEMSEYVVGARREVIENPPQDPEDTYDGECWVLRESEPQ